MEDQELEEERAKVKARIRAICAQHGIPEVNDEPVERQRIVLWGGAIAAIDREVDPAPN